MQDLRNSFRNFIERERLFTRADKLLLACSGGLDSTVLAHLLHAEGYDFAIAHMNFRLRGEDSEGDAAFVEELARTLGAKFHLKAVNVKEQALAGESTQMTARRLRYTWFQNTLGTEDYGFILTAHHQDDNLETSLINMMRGTGLAGIRGMIPSAHNIVRPFLGVSRASVVAYAAAHSLTWREDASNASDDYLRNRIRHHLLPILAEDFGLTPAKWAKNTQKLNRDFGFQQAGLRYLRDRYQTNRGPHYTEIRRSGWLREDKCLFEDYVHYRGRELGFTDDEIRQLLSFTGQRSLKGRSFTAYVSSELIAFRANSTARKPLTIISLEDLYKLPVFSGGYNAAAFSLTSRPENLEEPDTQFIAFSSLPLHLRPRKKGDRLQPLGMGGKSKKVKDYMIDEKIPVWLRDQIYLLVNEADEIMAIPGYCISEKFKVRPEDEQVLKIVVKPAIS